MSIIITGKQMEVGASLKEFINTELETVVKRYMDDPHEATVTITKDAHHQFKTDVTLHVGKRFLVHCAGSDLDAYKSVAAALEKLESQIRRYKTRLRSMRHSVDHEHRAEIVQKFVIKPQEEDTHDDNPLIIAETSSEIHTFSVGDAVMHMDLSNVPVVVFKNAANGQMNVVFKRNDGHVGWIDPSLKLA